MYCTDKIIWMEIFQNKNMEKIDFFVIYVMLCDLQPEVALPNKLHCDCWYCLTTLNVTNIDQKIDQKLSIKTSALQRIIKKY